LGTLTSEQSRAARALLNWPQVRLGAKSGFSEGTIRDFESNRRSYGPEKTSLIRQALEAAGVEFFVDDMGTPKVRLGAPARTNLSEGEAGIINNNDM